MISINWLTKVINVPLSYLTLVSPNNYSLDTNQFRLDLKDLEDGVDGIAFPTTHNHVQPISIGGVTLARVIEIINGYTVTFEDGQYAVNLSGSNNNIGDISNINQVSIRSSNSAGLIQVNSGSGLTTQQSAMLLELWRLAGLDAVNPMTVTPTQRTTLDIDLQITGDGVTTTTVSRQ